MKIILQDGNECKRTNHILVVSCIKQVPDTTQVKLDPITNALVQEVIPSIMNPRVIHALYESL